MVESDSPTPSPKKPHYSGESEGPQVPGCQVPPASNLQRCHTGQHRTEGREGDGDEGERE